MIIWMSLAYYKPGPSYIFCATRTIRYYFHTWNWYFRHIGADLLKCCEKRCQTSTNYLLGEITMEIYLSALKLYPTPEYDEIKRDESTYILNLVAYQRAWNPSSPSMLYTFAHHNKDQLNGHPGRCSVLSKTTFLSRQNAGARSGVKILTTTYWSHWKCRGYLPDLGTKAATSSPSLPNTNAVNPVCCTKSQRDYRRSKFGFGNIFWTGSIDRDTICQIMYMVCPCGGGRWELKWLKEGGEDDVRMIEPGV